MSNFARFLPAAALLLLSACGGGGGGSSEPETPAPQPDPPVSVDVSGKAFDGYVVGATVWLDINGNGTQDEGEPSAVTEAGGDYTMELDEEQAACLSWSTIYVDVPVGAMDETEGEVQEAYRMSLPPSLDPEPETEGINISPLTTVVWDSVAVALREAGKSISCEALQSDPDFVESIRAVLEGGTDFMVRHYNVPEDKIYADYIADGDADLQAKAVGIVRGLQASLRETISLSEEHPDAYVKVMYYTGTVLDDWATPDTWYKEVYIWSGSDGLENIVTEVTDDLSEEVKVVMHFAKQRTDYETHRAYSSTVWETRPGFEEGEYQCTLEEEIEWDHVGLDGSSLELQVTNIRSEPHVQSLAGCELVSESVADYQYVTVGYEPAEEVRASAQFSYVASTGIYNADITAQGVTAENLAMWGGDIAAMPYQFDLVDLAGASRVTRSHNWHKADGEVEWVRTSVTHYDDGRYRAERATEYPDGTYEKECAVEPDQWLPCDDPAVTSEG